MGSDDLRKKYVSASHLTNEFIVPEFESYKAYEEWKEENQELLTLWDRERAQRLRDDFIAGLLPEAEKGSASAVAQLRGLLGLSRPVGRPRGGTYKERQAELEHEHDMKEFSADIERLVGWR